MSSHRVGGSASSRPAVAMSAPPMAAVTALGTSVASRYSNVPRWPYSSGLSAALRLTTFSFTAAMMLGTVHRRPGAE